MVKGHQSTEVSVPDPGVCYSNLVGDLLKPAVARAIRSPATVLSAVGNPQARPVICESDRFDAATALGCSPSRQASIALQCSAADADLPCVEGAA